MRTYQQRIVGLVAATLCVVCFGGARAAAEPITAADWTERVGFKPDLSVAAFKPGMVIDKSNWLQVKDYIPESLSQLITKYALKLKTRKYEAVRPSDGYIAATNQNLGTAKTVDTGSDIRKLGITGYKSGLPFAQPKNGLEVAYNYHFAHFGDDADNHYGVYWVSAKTGVERWEEWRWRYILRTTHRTDVPPIPDIAEFAAKGIQYTSMTWALQPYDKRGFAALYHRYEEPRDQEGHIYIPTMRRVLRNTFGTRGDAWNSTDMLYEDVRGYMGYPEWMTWKIVGKRTILAPMHSGTPKGEAALKQTFDFETWPHWNPNFQWEPRAVYVVEATPKIRDYPYKRMVMYFDAETFYIPYKEAYDRKGQLWKILVIGFNKSPNPAKQPLDIAGALALDLQAEHASCFPFFNSKSNIDLKPDFFSLTNLRKMGR